MKLHECFKSVFGYSAGCEDWVKRFYKEVSGKELKMTFPMDLAIADWYGEKDVRETYENVIESWGSDYKSFTEFAISLIYMSYLNNQLVKQGIEGREKFIGLYENLYFQAREEFYKRFKDDEKAKRWFFDWTD